ncbi:MAG: hypothetical protein K5989_08165 [Lachnospiraceae bacterium]|nr:hypothetical protein [Lachnospiraceae bacterium]
MELYKMCDRKKEVSGEKMMPELVNGEYVEKLSEHEKEVYERIHSRGQIDHEEKDHGLGSLLNDLIRFNPFQYEPYYKPSKQTEYPKKIYIADEVGAGKTIETGIILTELLYRKEISLRQDRIVIICPNLLCRKWRDSGIF